MRQAIALAPTPTAYRRSFDNIPAGMQNWLSKSEIDDFREGEDMKDAELAEEPTSRSYLCGNIEGKCVRAMAGAAGRFFRVDRGEGICEACGQRGTSDPGASLRTD
jgi:hypothetical protein